MNIEKTLTPSIEDINFLTQKINQELPEFGSAYPFAFFVRNNAGDIIAGCNGSVVFGSIYTDQLWVHPDHRKVGLGRKLMERVHVFGREAGSNSAIVTTMSFQNALSFYEKLGYQIEFEREGYASASSCLLLRRNL